MKNKMKKKMRKKMRNKMRVQFLIHFLPSVFLMKIQYCTRNLYLSLEMGEKEEAEDASSCMMLYSCVPRNRWPKEKVRDNDMHSFILFLSVCLCYVFDERSFSSSSQSPLTMARYCCPYHSFIFIFVIAIVIVMLV